MNGSVVIALTFSIILGTAATLFTVISKEVENSYFKTAEPYFTDALVKPIPVKGKAMIAYFCPSYGFNIAYLVEDTQNEKSVVCVSDKQATEVPLL